jgi:MarR family 2-MHQ and catechol resistance regulon transcriptional repressor
MPPKKSNPFSPLSLRAQLTQPADQPFIDAGRALLKAGFLLVNRPARPYQAYDLTLAQMDVLGALARGEGANLCCSEIAERTLITKGGITGLLDRLEVRGLVRRLPSRADRRSVLVQLSAKGVELFRKLYPEVVRSNRSIFEKALRPEQMKQLTCLLTLLIRRLESELPAESPGAESSRSDLFDAQAAQREQRSGKRAGETGRARTVKKAFKNG